MYLCCTCSREHLLNSKISYNTYASHFQVYGEAEALVVAGDEIGRYGNLLVIGRTEAWKKDSLRRKTCYTGSFW